MGDMKRDESARQYPDLFRQSPRSLSVMNPLMTRPTLQSLRKAISIRLTMPRMNQVEVTPQGTADDPNNGFQTSNSRSEADILVASIDDWTKQ